MQKWEYAFIDFKNFGDFREKFGTRFTQDPEDFCNQIGAMGWELVTNYGVNGTQLIFKRPVEN